MVSLQDLWLLVALDVIFVRLSTLEDRSGGFHTVLISSWQLREAIILRSSKSGRVRRHLVDGSIGADYSLESSSKDTARDRFEEVEAIIEQLVV